jgi:O-antigen/teichoic acid export membrane protein
VSDKISPNSAGSVLKSSSIFLIFSILNRAIPFLLLPILTAYIDPFGYGVISVMALVTAFFMPLVGLCSNSVLFQRFFKLDIPARADFFTDSYKIILINTLLLLGLSVFLSGFIESALKVTLGWFHLAIILSGLGMITSLTTEVLLLQRKPFQYGFFMGLTALMNAGLAILLVVYFELSWQGRIWSLLATGLIMSLIAIFIAQRVSRFQIPALKFTSQGPVIVKLGSVLIPSAIGGWALAMTDRIFLTSMAGLEIMGVYAVGVMLSQTVDIFLNSLARAAHPFIAQYGASKDITERIFLARGIYGFAALAVIAVYGLSILLPFIMDTMINVRYKEAVQVVFWVSLGFAFSNIGGLFLGLLLTVEKNHISAYISCVTFCVSVVAAYFLIGENGMVGAGWANAGTGFVNMFLLIVACQIYNPLPWLNRQVIGPIRR